jgi:hypothetical protein
VVGHEIVIALQNALLLYCDNQKPLEAEGFLRVP